MRSEGEALSVKRSAFVRYGVAVLAVALAFLLKELLADLVLQETPFLLVLGAVMVAAWFGGLGPGLLATAVAAPIVDYFFLPPLNSFSGLSLQSLPLVLFVLEGLLVSSLAAVLRSSRLRAEASALKLRRSEQRLQHTLDSLLAIYETVQILGSSLKREEIGSRSLETVQRVFDLSAAAIELREDRGEWRVLGTVGQESLWRWACRTSEAQDARRAALENQEHRSFELRASEPDGAGLTGICVPLGVRERVVGVLETYGSQTLAKQENAKTLAILSGQTASALENARLYEELAERERRLLELVRRMLVAQEEERRRIAYDIHDGLAQIASAAHNHLYAFARHHLPDTAQGKKELDRTLELLEETVQEARNIISDLRPTALDDLGLVTALRLQVEKLRVEGLRTSYEETLGDERLPDAMETTLFRVAQEALTNIRKHAHSPRAQVRLEYSDHTVRLVVRDWGRGFEPGEATNGGSRSERVGLASMQERVALLGGSLEVRSRPGAGTTIVAEIPLPEKDANNGR